MTYHVETIRFRLSFNPRCSNWYKIWANNFFSGTDPPWLFFFFQVYWTLTWFYSSCAVMVSWKGLGYAVKVFQTDCSMLILNKGKHTFQDPRSLRQFILFSSLSECLGMHCLFGWCPPDYKSMCFGGGKIYDDRVPLLFPLKSNIHVTVISLNLY